MKKQSVYLLSVSTAHCASRLSRYFGFAALCVMFAMLNISFASAERVRIDHYAVKDGLSEGTVVSIFQDRTGIMWFGTFAGLNRFDGYNFRTYKAPSDKHTGLVHNRVDHITEDAYGFLWLVTYAGQAQRFDPRTEEFLSIGDYVPRRKAKDGAVTNLYNFADGEIWLTTTNDGAYRVLTNPDDYSISLTRFEAPEGSEGVNRVYKDWKKNIWLLTDNGLLQITPADSVPQAYFATDHADGDASLPFYSVFETDRDVLFGSSGGRVWIYNKERGDFRSDSFPFASPIVDIKRISNGSFLVVSRSDGFMIYHPGKAGNERQLFSHATHPQMPAGDILQSYVDRHGDIWFETEAAGVLHLDTKLMRLDRFVVPSDKTSPYLITPNFLIFEDKHDRLWVNPRWGGFSWYDREAGCLRPFYNEPGSPNRRFSNLIHSALSDMQGNLWLGTYSTGIEKITFGRSSFELVRPDAAGANGLYGNEVRALFQDSDSLFWISTKDATLYLMDKNLRKLGTIGPEGKLGRGKPFDAIVYTIMQDRRGRIWLGTKGMGIYVLTKRAAGDYDVAHYAHSSDDTYSLSHNAVYSIFEDRIGNVWVGTFGGGLNLVDQTDASHLRFYNYHNALRGYPMAKCSKIRKVASDSFGNIWLATSAGIVTFKDDFNEPADIRFNYLVTADDNNLPPNYDVHYILSTRNRELYFATYGAGLLRLDGLDEGEPRFRTYNMETGAPSDIILNLAEDDKGNLWMASANGLLNFNPRTEEFLTYSSEEGLECSVFSEGSIMKSADRRIGFGTNEGLYLFSPSRMLKKQFVPPLIFTDFQLFGRKVMPADEGSPITSTINYADRVTLRHDQSVITIGFAALDFEGSRNMQYRYRLLGFEKEWQTLQGEPHVTYTNLPKGDYVFQVSSSNGDGVWCDNMRELPIRVLPSFWESTWGYLLYFAGIVLLLAVILYVQSLLYDLKHKVTLEKKMSDLKLRFFTDISHELRTPLTLIASPVGYLAKRDDLPDEAREQLSMVQRNVDRMLRLVNQILDFRKIQNNKMKMKVERIAIGDFTARVCDSFKTIAGEKGISFRFIDDSDGISIWGDKDKIEKILFNLIANAFKFTPEGKTIEVAVTHNDQSVSIRVQDEGMGMTPEKLSHLFVRFDSSVSYDGFQAGTGIGLSLTKELVDMHRATILADSRVGYGTWFTVTFLLGTKHFEGNTDFIVTDGESPEIAPAEPTDGTGRSDSTEKTDNSESPIGSESSENVENADSSENFEISDSSESSDNAALPSKDDRQSILIVEDNEELRAFLRAVLSRQFAVIEAADGEEGLRKALEQLPDIIISDVMMPKMDGLEFVEAIKSNVRTSHTPVILLTARTAMEDKLAALDRGADDYITKPFSAEYLDARIHNLLQQRRKLQEAFRASVEETKPEGDAEGLLEVEPSKPKVISQDELFIQELLRALEENMENSELTVDDLVHMAGLSRSVFFKKLKSLTGLAPIEFIREIRIKRAAQLIETRQYNISQVAYMVGMNDPRYFSRCFKQKYGMTPTEYKQAAEVKKN